MLSEMPMKRVTQKEWREFKGATKCHTCFEEFEEDNKFSYKVRDHCHYVRLYRAPAHRTCNQRYKIPRCISIAFHNLSGYNAHLFIRELGIKFDSGSIGVIDENKEKYISFNVDVVVGSYEDMWGRIKKKKIQLKFINSIRFMVSSLNSLSRNLVGMNGMTCNKYGSQAELTHIDKIYVAHEICGTFRGDSHHKRMIEPIFDNIKVRHRDKQFQLLLRIELIHMNT